MSSPTRNSRPRLRIASIGQQSHDAILGGHAAHVLAVFERSLHIAAGDRIVCIGDASIGNGPLNALIEAHPAEGWTSAFSPMEPLTISSRLVKVARCDFDFSDASIWHLPPWPQPSSGAQIRAVLAHVATTARDRAPREGLARLILLDEIESEQPQARALARIATPRIAALAHWLGIAAAREALPEFPAAALGLIGLGPGLTPSGDDVLCGVLLALHTHSRPNIARTMADAVLAAARDATTRLSRAFLEAAAEGQASEALHDFVSALICANEARLAPAIGTLGRIGHTSGWDALAGACMALNACAAPHPPTRSP